MCRRNVSWHSATVGFQAVFPFSRIIAGGSNVGSMYISTTSLPSTYNTLHKDWVLPQTLFYVIDAYIYNTI